MNAKPYLREVVLDQGAGPLPLSYPGTKILPFDDAGISECAYEDTEHYAVTRDFLNHYPRRLQQLLGGDDEA